MKSPATSELDHAEGPDQAVQQEVPESAHFPLHLRDGLRVPARRRGQKNVPDVRYQLVQGALARVDRVDRPLGGRRVRADHLRPVLRHLWPHGDPVCEPAAVRGRLGDRVAGVRGDAVRSRRDIVPDRPDGHPDLHFGDHGRLLEPQLAHVLRLHRRHAAHHQHVDLG
ncbi:hypothetical protein KL921_004944 [Ogataea angusta]|nr:hypothetical protein KL921_004944 [Ogataea angusta]KAG7852974.1 hypothetical protein KL941_000024 [Ogataea angusta]